MIKIEVYGTASEIAAELQALIGNLTGSAAASTQRETAGEEFVRKVEDLVGTEPDREKQKRGVAEIAVTIMEERGIDRFELPPGYGPEVTYAPTHEPTPAPVVEEKPADPPKRGRGRPPKAKPAEEKAPLISTEPENRIDPAAEDDAETAAQDEADEIAEAAAKAPAEKALTHDDLRQAMGNYVKAFGMPAAQEDGPKIFEKALGPVPDGTKDAKGETVTSWKVSAVPADQKALSAAIQFWTAAIDENPFQRTRVA